MQHDPSEGERSAAIDADHDAASPSKPAADVHAHGGYAADVEAFRARQLLQWEGTPEPLVCHACETPIEGEPAGRGLLLFARGEDVTFEEPPLCEACALAIGMTALFRFEEEEEEG